METVAEQFTQFFYSAFDTDRTSLASLYRDASMLSWEGQNVQGATAIMEKLTTLPFDKVTHHVSTLDTQLSSNTNIVVLVTGHLKVDDTQNPIQYTEVFHLVSEGGTFYVLNDVFRLIYA